MNQLIASQVRCRLAPGWFLAVALAAFLAAAPASAFRAEKPAPADQSGQEAAAVRAGPYRAPSAAQAMVSEQAQAAGITVKWNERLGTPQCVRGRNLLQPGAPFKARGELDAAAAPEQKALAVLGSLAELYAIQNAANEFKIKTIQRDALGFQHAKLTQVSSGLRVVGGELIVHFNAQGEAYEVNGQYVPDIALDVKPAIGAEQAGLAAQKDQAALGLPAGKIVQDPELVIFAHRCQPALAYELTIAQTPPGQTPGRWRYWIDARTGAVSRRFNDIKTVVPPTTGVHTTLTGSVLSGEGGGATNIIGWFNTPNSYYYLYNTNSHWIISNAAASGYTDNRSYAYRNNTDWGISDRTEISAANNFHMTQQYFSNIHSRASFDNANALANANIHYGVNYANAYWDPSETNFTFGDGNAAVAVGPLTALDVIGHEFGHAVTEYSANLYYDYVDSGALSESFSDIFGTCIEFHSQPDGSATYPYSSPGTFDWLVGEDAILSPYRALRDMRNPSGSLLLEGQHPSRYKGSYWDSGGEMHYNSTVQSFMFYLLCQGGSGNNDGITYNVTGIALTNAERIAYRTLTVYLTQFACYADAQDAWISAATDLNTNWVASVRQAWAAVGFSDVTSSSLGTAVNAPDYTWFTGGNTNWFSQTTITHDGVSAAQSGHITHDQMAKIYTPVTGPGVVSFWWKVSSESNWDFLSFYIDGTNQASISGEVDWQYMSYTFGEGTHILKWAYNKDTAVSSNYDAGWLDEVTITFPLQVTASSGTYADRIALSWVPKSDATLYEIWRAPNAADTNQAIHLYDTTATSYSDTSATAGVIYYYWIRAQTPSGPTAFNYYSAGWRAWSLVPTGVCASDGTYNDKVLVSWNAAASAVGYLVYRNTSDADSGAAVIGSTADVIFNDTSATPSVNYYYWVKGVDNGGVAGGFSMSDTGWRAATPDPDPESTNIPALRATDFQLAPTVIQLGAAPTQTIIRIVNTAASTTNARINLTVYLSGSGTFGDPNNLTLGTVQRYVSLAAGQSADVQLNSAERAGLRVPNTAALGYYTAFLKAALTGSSSTNNVLTLANSIRLIPSRLADRDDFDGDGKSDLAVYNPSTGIWNIRGSATGNESTFNCGGPGQVAVSGDFDGDNKADLAAYAESSGDWIFLLSGSLYGTALLDGFGGTGFLPVSGDFDGDGKFDPAVFNANTGAWLVKLSGSAYASASATLGSAGSKAVSGDFDGDGKSDPAVYQPSTALWQVMMSANNYAVASAVFGDANCTPVSGDFDGDLKSDPALYRQTDGLWAVMLSASAYAAATTRFGEPGFVALSGDFDGDGKTDLALYQTGYGNWYFRLSKTGYPLTSAHFGSSGFAPIAAGD